MFSVYVVMFLLYISSASSIRCYDCNSQNNSMCLDPSIYDQDTLAKFLPATSCGQGVVSADPHGFFCRKIVQTIFYNDECVRRYSWHRRLGDQWAMPSIREDVATCSGRVLHKGYEPDVRVTRGCGWIRHHKDCYKADNEDHLETVCQCFSEGCNGAGNQRISLALLWLVTVILGLKMI